MTTVERVLLLAEQWAEAGRGGEENDEPDGEAGFGLRAVGLAKEVLDGCGGLAVERHAHPRQGVERDAAAEDERGNNESHADEDWVDLVAHADAFADTGDHGIAALVTRDAGRARVPHLVESRGVHTYIVTHCEVSHHRGTP